MMGGCFSYSCTATTQPSNRKFDAGSNKPASSQVYIPRVGKARCGNLTAGSGSDEPEDYE